MNNKGFTLIELLVTIGLIAIAATTIVVNIVGMQGTTENTEEKRFEKKVAEAGCLYVDRGQTVGAGSGPGLKLSTAPGGAETIDSRDDCKVSGCYVSISRLLDEGLLDENLVDYDNGKVKITDDAGTLLDSEKGISVHIKWENYPPTSYKQKVCEFVRN